MVNPVVGDDFYARALASLNQQIANAAATAEADIEDCAKSLVEDDLPKIDSAAKSYLSLVAARSAVASDIDVLSASAASSHHVQCTFASATSPMDANRCALMCARTLLSAINSTIIPANSSAASGEPTGDDANNNEEAKDAEEKVKAQLQKDAAKVLWNKLVLLAKGADAKAKQTKPSKVLGRDSLIVAYPYIEERFRRGTLLVDNGNEAAPAGDGTTDTNNPLASFSDEEVPPVAPPAGIDVDQWKAFYTEFGHLLSRACHTNADKGDGHSPKVEDDSALLWSCDKGSVELRQRRESRAQRATEALASVEGANAAVADALVGASTTGIEEERKS